MIKLSKTELILLSLLIIWIIIFFLKSCSDNANRKQLEEQLTHFNLEKQYFTVEKQKDSSTIAIQKQTILSQSVALKNGLIEINKLKDIQSQVKQEQKIKIDTIWVEYQKSKIDSADWVKKIMKDGISNKNLLDSFVKNSILVPRNFNTKNKWFELSGKVEKKGVMIDSFTIENKSTVTLGKRKYGFLKLKSEPVVEIKNTNPYLKTENVSNIIVKEKKNVFATKGFWFGVGAVAGILLKLL